jgi:hypothetical protein
MSVKITVAPGNTFVLLYRTIKNSVSKCQIFFFSPNFFTIKEINVYFKESFCTKNGHYTDVHVLIEVEQPLETGQWNKLTFEFEDNTFKTGVNGGK